MRWIVLALCLPAIAAGTPSATACDAKAEIEAAFLKQQKSTAWRTVDSTKTEGGLQEQTFEYLPPDRMRRIVSVPREPRPVETIGIGRWAWVNAGAGWEELKPHFAQMVMSHIQQTFSAPPQVSVAFNCLGEVTYEGKKYLGYQSAPEKAPDGVELTRTIYIDPATGLPAFNIIGTPKGEAEPVHKESYAYPADIVIEKPL